MQTSFVKNNRYDTVGSHTSFWLLGLGILKRALVFRSLYVANKAVAVFLILLLAAFTPLQISLALGIDAEGSGGATTLQEYAEIHGLYQLEDGNYSDGETRISADDLASQFAQSQAEQQASVDLSDWGGWTGSAGFVAEAQKWHDQAWKIYDDAVARGVTPEKNPDQVAAEFRQTIPVHPSTGQRYWGPQENPAATGSAILSQFVNQPSMQKIGANQLPQSVIDATADAAKGTGSQFFQNVAQPAINAEVARQQGGGGLFGGGFFSSLMTVASIGLAFVGIPAVAVTLSEATAAFVAAAKTTMSVVGIASSVVSGNIGIDTALSAMGFTGIPSVVPSEIIQAGGIVNTVVKVAKNGLDPVTVLNFIGGVTGNPTLEDVMDSYEDDLLVYDDLSSPEEAADISGEITTGYPISQEEANENVEVTPLAYAEDVIDTPLDSEDSEQTSWWKTLRDKFFGETAPSADTSVSSADSENLQLLSDEQRVQLLKNATTDEHGFVTLPPKDIKFMRDRYGPPDNIIPGSNPPAWWTDNRYMVDVFYLPPGLGWERCLANINACASEQISPPYTDLASGPRQTNAGGLVKTGIEKVPDNVIDEMLYEFNNNPDRVIDSLDRRHYLSAGGQLQNAPLNSETIKRFIDNMMLQDQIYKDFQQANENALAQGEYGTFYITPDKIDNLLNTTGLTKLPSNVKVWFTQDEAEKFIRDYASGVSRPSWFNPIEARTFVIEGVTDPATLHRTFPDKYDENGNRILSDGPGVRNSVVTSGNIIGGIAGGSIIAGILSSGSENYMTPAIDGATTTQNSSDAISSLQNLFPSPTEIVMRPLAQLGENTYGYVADVASNIESTLNTDTAPTSGPTPILTTAPSPSTGDIPSSASTSCSPLFNTPCESASVNSCGQRGRGSYDCAGNCLAIPPLDSSCPAPTTCENPAATNFEGLLPCIFPAITVTGHLRANPLLLRSGATTKISWGVSNASSCSVSGTNGDGTAASPTGRWNTLSSGTAGKTSSPIQGQTTYTLLCASLPGATPPSFSESQTVNIIPNYNE